MNAWELQGSDCLGTVSACGPQGIHGRQCVLVNGVDIKRIPSSTPLPFVRFVVVSPSPETPSPTLEGFRDIDDIIAEAERNGEDREALAEARVLLAEKLYPEEVSIRALRLKAGLSQKALGEIMGTSQSHVARIERNGTSVEIKTAVSLASALNADFCTVVRALSGAV
ncbi:MAG: helix-turn-helix domain-containing protein [Acidiferrobacter sp.]